MSTGSDNIRDVYSVDSTNMNLQTLVALVIASLQRLQDQKQVATGMDTKSTHLTIDEETGEAYTRDAQVRLRAGQRHRERGGKRGTKGEKGIMSCPLIPSQV